MNKQQLAARIWRLANQMRSKIEASEYKDYILGFVFYKFLSQQEVQFLKNHAWDDEDIAELSEDSPKDVKYIQDNLGYFIAYKNLYSTWLKSGADFDISCVHDACSDFARLVSKEHKAVYEGIFTTLDTGLSKLGDTTAKQTKAVADLLDLIDPIPMDGREDYDVLGYIYEYLISQFAANAGKKAGEFYTPHEVAILMSDIVAGHLKGKDAIDIYDPTSGSASLLLTIGQSVAAKSGTSGMIHYYAQELKSNTFNLTRMNLVMRGINPSNITAKNADTLADDWPMEGDGEGKQTDQPLLVDACVSNPPYSQKWTPPTGPDPRFAEYDIAPKGKADYAFLLHNLYHLKRDGIMCIVLPHGVLFRGDAEGEIRKKLLEGGHIDTIIGLPANIFFGTGIPTIVMVLKKVRAERDVLFIDASRGFVKEGKKNKLRSRDIRRVVDAYEARKTQPGFSKLATFKDIKDNDYNLNIPRYVDAGDGQAPQDLYATMFGGIPISEVDALEAYWKVFPGLRERLFAFDETAGVAHMATEDVTCAIQNNEEVSAYKTSFKSAFDDYEAYLYEELVDETSLVNVSSEEEVLAQDLFKRLAGIPLVDKYEAYQVLDENWQSTSADLEMIQSEGFDAIRRVDRNMVFVTKDGKEEEVQDKKEPWIGHILPFSLVQKQFFIDELGRIHACDTRIAAIDSELSSLIDNMSEEDQDSTLLNDDNSAFVEKEVALALKELAADIDSPEIRALKGYLSLLDIKAKKPDKLAFIQGHAEVHWERMEANKDGTYGKKKVKDYLVQCQMEIGFDAEGLGAVLASASELISEQKRLKKEARDLRGKLVLDTKSRIEELSDSQCLELLSVKWIDGLIDALNEIPDEVLSGLSMQLEALRAKYAVTLSQIGEGIARESASLLDLLGQLTGSKRDMAGVQELATILGGE